MFSYKLLRCDIECLEIELGNERHRADLALKEVERFQEGLRLIVARYSTSQDKEDLYHYLTELLDGKTLFINENGGLVSEFKR